MARIRRTRSEILACVKLYLVKVKACQEAGTPWNQSALVDGMGLSHFPKSIVPDLRGVEVDDAFVTKFYNTVLALREPQRQRQIEGPVFPGEVSKVRHSVADYAAAQRRAEDRLANLVPPGHSRIVGETGGRSHGKTARAMGFQTVKHDDERRTAFANALKDIRAHEAAGASYNLNRICRRWRIPVFPAGLVPPVSEELTWEDIDDIYDNAVNFWRVRKVRRRIFPGGELTLFHNYDEGLTAAVAASAPAEGQKPGGCLLRHIWQKVVAFFRRIFSINHNTR